MISPADRLALRFPVTSYPDQIGRGTEVSVALCPVCILVKHLTCRTGGKTLHRSPLLKEYEVTRNS